MTKIWIDGDLVHVQDDDHRVAATLDEFYEALGQDFAKRIAARVRSEGGRFALMRRAVADWLEAEGWKK